MTIKMIHLIAQVDRPAKPGPAPPETLQLTWGETIAIMAHTG